MRAYVVEVGGHCYQVTGTDVDVGARRAIDMALKERPRDVRDLARGPVGLSVTVWDRGSLVDHLDDQAAAGEAP